MNPYFTVNDSEHFTFYRIPKLLFTDEIYQTVSTDAKMLYGLLLDRLSLSEKNDWKDEHGRVYQYFTIHQAQELLHFGHEKVCRLFAELDAADLISPRFFFECLRYHLSSIISFSISASSRADKQQPDLRRAYRITGDTSERSKSLSASQTVITPESSST